MEKVVTAFTNCITPQKNREYEVYVFRDANQESDEGISAFNTLQRLTMICEFANTDRNQNPDCADLFVAQTSQESITKSQTYLDSAIRRL